MNTEEERSYEIWPRVLISAGMFVRLLLVNHSFVRLPSVETATGKSVGQTRSTQQKNINTVTSESQQFCL